MYTATFDTVNWDDLRNTLALKPKSYQLWPDKEGSYQCRTGVMLERWDKKANSRCPNCRVTNEDAAYLNKCAEKDQRLMLIKCTKEIKE